MPRAPKRTTTRPSGGKQEGYALRILKWLMIFMIALVVLALLLVGYFYATARVSIVAYKANGVSAAERPDDFAQAKEALAQNPSLYDPKEFGKAGRARVKALVIQRMLVCGASGKARA